MPDKDLLIPFYCDNCNRLTFLLKAENGQDPLAVEFDQNQWKRHQCAELKGEMIWKKQLDPGALNWGIETLPLKKGKTTKLKGNARLSYGVLLSEKTSAEISGFYPVLGVENTLIYVRSIEPLELGSAGVLVDLKGAQKVGPGKYRLQKIVSVDIKQELYEDEQKRNKEFLGLMVTALDQEQLERFLDKLVLLFSKGNLFSHAILPLPLKREEGTIKYQRQLLLPSAKNLPKIIANLTIPDTIQIDVKQID